MIGESLVRALLVEAGLDTADVAGRGGILGEDDARIVWCAFHDSVPILLSEWEAEQAWFVDHVSERVETVDKAWELYLVLVSASGPRNDELAPLEAVRRDAHYTRKIIVPGIQTLLPISVSSILAPLRPLTLSSDDVAHSAIEGLLRAAKSDVQPDVVDVIEAFRTNRPLFEELT